MAQLKNQYITRNEDDESLITALIVDDDRMMRLMLEKQVEHMGYRAISAGGGEEALTFLQNKNNSIDIVILDQEMPGMKGLELLRIMKESKNLERIPVIMVTGYDQGEEIRKGIDAGVFYYLTKPLDEAILQSVVVSAAREVQQQNKLKAELQKHKTGFALICSCRFVFKTVTEAEHLSAFLANCYPDPERVLPGLARLMINAVEHGNLAMSYDDKTEFFEKGNWQQEVERRAALPIFQSKVVEVLFEKGKAGYSVSIEDQGKGFDWQQYLEIDPARAMDTHGRGIAQAKATSFDELYYNEIGNKVTAIVHGNQNLEW